jgi:hypothetical protein
MRDIWEVIGGLPHLDTYHDSEGKEVRVARLLGAFRHKIGREFKFGGLRSVLESQVGEMKRAGFSYLERQMYKEQFVRDTLEHYGPMAEDMHRGSQAVERASRGVGFPFDPANPEGEFVGAEQSSGYRATIRDFDDQEVDVRAANTGFAHGGDGRMHRPKDEEVFARPSPKEESLFKKIHGSKSEEELTEIMGSVDPEVLAMNDQIRDKFSRQLSTLRGQ